MNDKEIEQILESLANQEKPTVNSQSKMLAMHAALNEFSMLHEDKAVEESLQNKKRQGFLDSLRHMGKAVITLITDVIHIVITMIRRIFMAIPTSKKVYGALAGVVGVTFCAAIVFHLSPLMKPEKTQIIESDMQVYVPKVQPIAEEEMISKTGVASKSDAAVSQTTEDKISSDANFGGSLIDEATTAKPRETIELQQTPVLQDGDAVSQSDLMRSKEVVATSNSTSVQAKGQQTSEQQFVVQEKARGMDLSVTSSMISRAEPQMKKAERKRKVIIPQSSTNQDAIYPPITPLVDRDEFPTSEQNGIKQVSLEPVSTFSIDVDTSSYSVVRSRINSGFLPPKDAVRVEEMINYFDYQYALPSSREIPFKPSITVLPSPWNKGKKLIHIGVKGFDTDPEQQPDSNLVFLLDVSGSMNQPDKLPLVKQSVGLLLDKLKPTDTVSIVVYAGAAGVVLEPTKVKDRTKIITALSRLRAGGSTAGSAGLELAYKLAELNYDKSAVNRVILATDGDFNVGRTGNRDLQSFIEHKRNQGVFLSVLGFGRGNYQDDMMQILAQNGNGVAAYIDSLSEAKKVLVDEATSMLFPIAKDVKIQLEFNPEKVSEYRLIGYETRALNREDFNNDKVDAGDIGAGHTVTAIYEITPVEAGVDSVDKLRYAEPKKVPSNLNNQEYGYLKIRYKLPNESKSKLIETAVTEKLTEPKWDDHSEANFSIAVAGFAQLLKGGKHLNNYSYNDVINAAQKYKGDDIFGYRNEFIQLVRMAKIANP